MSRNKKNDLLYLLNILVAIKKIEIYRGDVLDADSLYQKNDQLEFNACLTLLTHIGETVNKISEELKSSESHIDWININGFRNRIAHDYTGLDIYIVYRIISEELPNLEQHIYPVVRKHLEQGTFDEKELLSAKGSEFYKLINYSRLLQ